MFRFTDIYSLTSLYAGLYRCGGRIDWMIRTFGLDDFCWNVRVFADISEMSGFLKFSLPRWVKAFSYGSTICFLNQAYWLEPEKNGYEQLIVHESTHCLTARRYGRTMPRWFDEAAAMYFAGQLGDTAYTGFPTEDCQIHDLEYDEPQLYGYASLFMRILLKEYSIGEILRLADNSENFAPDGALGDKVLREMYSTFKEI